MERVIGGNERGWDTGVDSVVGKKGIVRSDYRVFPIRRPEGGRRCTSGFAIYLLKLFKKVYYVQAFNIRYG